MTNKLEKLKKKMEEADVAHAACYVAYDDARDAAYAAEKAYETELNKNKMTNKLEQLKKEMEEAEIAKDAAITYATAAHDAIDASEIPIAEAFDAAEEAFDDAWNAALTYKTTKEAYNNELNKNND